MLGAPSFCKELHLNASISGTWPTVSSLLFSSQLPDVKTLSPVTNARTNSLYFSYGQSRLAERREWIWSSRHSAGGFPVKTMRSSSNILSLLRLVYVETCWFCSRMKWTLLRSLPNYTQDWKNMRLHKIYSNHRPTRRSNWRTEKWPCT
jgi:hypothetical protein